MMSDAFDRTVKVAERSFEIIDSAYAKLFDAYRLCKDLLERLIQITQGEEKKDYKRLLKGIEGMLKLE